ncbi:hypothetical protein [Streptomyces asoensis]|uniref:hypothetical protein n=1 Tax=Streptomyces asoensis TaxID=249586 RepID=UPI0033CC4412
MRTPLAAVPSVIAPEQVLPIGTGQMDGTKEPLALWRTVWDWSPLLPAPVLAALVPLLERLRRLKPAGPPTRYPASVPSRKITAGTAEGLVALAEGRGPVAAATFLAAASDTGDSRYGMVLHRLVAADPVAWANGGRKRRPPACAGCAGWSCRTPTSADVAGPS